MKFDDFQVGDRIQFRYNGKLRSGPIESIGEDGQSVVLADQPRNPTNGKAKPNGFARFSLPKVEGEIRPATPIGWDKV